MCVCVCVRVCPLTSFYLEVEFWDGRSKIIRSTPTNGPIRFVHSAQSSLAVHRPSTNRASTLLNCSERTTEYFGRQHRSRLMLLFLFSVQGTDIAVMNCWCAKSSEWYSRPMRATHLSGWWTTSRLIYSSPVCAYWMWLVICMVHKVIFIIQFKWTI